jgi:hypothetical protein
MHKYTITTDAGTTEIQAPSAEVALAKWGRPDHRIHSPEEFVAWLKKSDAYGAILEDGAPIARVAA